MAVRLYRSCDDVLRKMFDYLDAEVDLLTSLRIDGHLSKCTGCRELLGRQRRLLNAFRQAAPPPTDLEALRLRVQAALAGTFGETYH